MFGKFKNPTHEWKIYTEDGELRMVLSEHTMSQWVYTGAVNMTGNDTAEFVDNLKLEHEGIRIYMWKADRIKKCKIK